MTEEFSEEKDESLEQSTPPEVPEQQPQNESEEVPDTQEEEEELDPLTQCQEDLVKEKDQRLRITAELVNYRRRMEGQRVEWSARAQAGVVRTLLPILDDLERSLDAAKETGSEDAAFLSLQSGITLVHENFLGELGKLGLQRIQTVGEKFDEHWHEAVGQELVSEKSEGDHIRHEVQAGYRLGDQVLRHAKVIVAVATSDPALLAKLR